MKVSCPSTQIVPYTLPRPNASTQGRSVQFGDPFRADDLVWTKTKFIKNELEYFKPGYDLILQKNRLRLTEKAKCVAQACE